MKTIFKSKILPFILAITFFVIAHFLHKLFSNNTSPAVNDFEKTLHKKEERLKKEMSLLAKRVETQSYSELFSKKAAYYNAMLEKDGLAVLIYENDTLKFWSDNSIAVENWIKEVCLDTKMAKLHNGWFEVMRPHTNASTTKNIVGLILIKNEYPYQNKYLINEFQKNFSLPAETKLITDSSPIDNSQANTAIKNFEGDYLFSLKFNTTIDATSTLSSISVLLNIIAFLFFILFLKNSCLYFENKIGANNATLLFVISIIFFRYLSIKLSFPEVFQTFDLFSPNIYADANSLWLSSLGNLLINVLILFYLVYVISNRYIFNGLTIRLKSINKLLFAFILLLIFFWFSWLITSLFVGLIKNSNIPFSINNLFSLNQYSYVAIFIIGLLLFIYFLLTDKMVSVLNLLTLNNKQYIFLFSISAAIHIIISHLLGTLDLIVIFWPFVLLITIAVIKQKQQQYPFSGVIILVFLFSLYAVHIFIKHTGLKESESQKIYVERLAAEQDHIAELLFQDVAKKVEQDSILMSYVNGAEKQATEFEKRLKQQHFSGFWEKYDVRIALFDSACMPTIQSPNISFDNNLYFDELITQKGIATTSENFTFLKNASGKISYIAKIPVYKSVSTLQKFGTLYIELDAKFISDEIGFPELLLDRNIGLSEELANYSYAKYKHNQLISQYGKYSYNLSGNNFNVSENNFEFLNKDGYSHLLFRPDKETLIVLSKICEGAIGDITIFSYLFTFFSLLLLFILFFRQVSLGRLLDNFSFKNRIQILLVFIVLTSLALFGGGTIYYIKQQFEIKNQQNISEKTHSVLIDIEGKLSSETTLHKNLTDYISFILKKSSSIFFTDINLYDTQGNLYASSRSKIFDEGLTSKKMNPEAFLQMAILGKTEFIHDERIGKLEYLSAYIPFKNKDGKVLAYLNLPYFAKQNVLEKEISGFLVALINIYVLLFALSIIMAIFISNYVTKPLKLIQDKLSKIKLGKTNEPIDWEDNDEIGSLVKEYNRMISELSQSAELLAKSERESAWREMAKQVAHEIKNPLTPMKLSVQHLQRAWKDNAPDMDKKMERLTQTIIEQIETLSSIATEFSNFAKMPKANLEEIDIQQILKNTIVLFNDSENFHINFKSENNQHSLVLADKDQLLRVFNNLLKNAMQSIPENRKGEINIITKEENNNLIISISDNGIGIKKDILDKIFVPNFTTKTGGMGLGLAMVKNIVESIGGKIWFETKSDEGTTFYVSIPCLDADSLSNF